MRTPPRPCDVRWRSRRVGPAPAAGDAAVLSPADRRRAARIRSPAVRARFVAGRALLREVVAELAPELDPRAFAVEVAPSGRLTIAGRPDLGVSVSHTRGFVVAAVCRGRDVGIDVEPLGRRGLPPSAAWLTTAEERELADLPPQTRREALLRRWVAKEATLKACDRTRPVTRRAIEVDAREGTVRVSRCGGAGGTCRPAVELAAVGWYLVADRFLVAIATRAGGPGHSPAAQVPSRRVSSTPSIVRESQSTISACTPP
jgi:4'-phosphopantetheinyl transferase EntD